MIAVAYDRDVVTSTKYNDVSMGSFIILGKKSYTRIFRTGRFDCIYGTISVCRLLNKSFQSRLVEAAEGRSDAVP